MALSRRQLCRTLAACTAGAVYAGPTTLLAQQPSSNPLDSDRERMLRAAAAALTTPVAPPVQPPPASAGQAMLKPGTFFSVVRPGDTPELHFAPAAAALKQASMHIAALTAGFVLTGDARYALRAGQWLFAWLVAPGTRLRPGFDHARCEPGDINGTPAGILDAVALAEVARALPFLADTAALSPPDHEAALAWFHDLQGWLNDSKLAGLARDGKDHTGSAWLLLAAATARLLRDETGQTTLSALFRRPTLRNQMRADGSFPHEVASAFPYRNTLLNFELLTAACQTLSTPFNNLWEFELPEGLGLRSAPAYLYPVVADRARWPWPADAEGFRELPGRRHGLLFSGRAYTRPEYLALWQRLPDASADPTMQPSLPVTQPLLWIARAPHGA